MKLKILASPYVQEGKCFVIDPSAGGALAEAMRVHLDLSGDQIDCKVVYVATDALKERLEGFARIEGIEVVR